MSIKYFTLKELTKTNQNINNEMSSFDQLENIIKLGKFLDVVRGELGLPIFVNSGFRSNEVNNAVGGSINSAHLYGAAADIWCEDNNLLEGVLKKHIKKLDQLIIYKNKSGDINFFHVGLPFSRNQILIK